MTPSDFVHLHVHGQSSLLDGLTKAPAAVAAVVADGQPAIASTDHHTLAATYQYAKAAADAGIKYLPGSELYMAIGSRFEENSYLVPNEDDMDGGESAGDGMKKKIYEHLTVIAHSKVGWRNLQLIDFKTRLANDDGRSSVWGKPRADYELLAQHSEGLTVGSGCLGGPVAGPLNRGDLSGARAGLARLVDIFGAENVFVEVMDHGIAQERKVIPGLTALAAEFGLPVMATNDCHYTGACDATAHDAWLAISTKKQITDEDRFRFKGSGYHIRTAAEMHAIFDDQPGTENAVANTLLVAQKAEDDIVLGSILPGHRLPNYPVPSGEGTVNQYFHRRVFDGLVERYGLPLPAEVKRRARYEEDTIVGFGMASYFLTKADAIRDERAAGGLVGYGRGSGAGVLCAYALGITGINPLRYDLIFERFMNPERASLPDFDTDFQASRQRIVIDREASRYGHDKVARIGTTGVARSKDALKKIGRVTDQTQLATQLAGMVPEGDAKKITLVGLLDPANPGGLELRTAVESDSDAAALVELASAIEGSASNESIHACGVIISDTDLPGAIPLRTVSKTDLLPVTQWEAGEVEAAGYVKFDFLAIKDWDVIADAVRLVKDVGHDVDVYGVDPDDLTDPRTRAAYDMLAEGRTAGVFQVAGDGITKLTRDVRPESLDDLSAILALYRPGPMGADMHGMYARRRRGGEAVDYAVYTNDPAEQAVIAGVLGTTLGSCIYQEQLMLLAKVMADFTAGQMKDLQGAVSKKKQSLMDSLKEVWMTGGQSPVRADGTPKQAFGEPTLEGLWRTFEASGSYMFNRSHSVAYGMVTFITAYLKANWPAQYGAALLLNTSKGEKRQQVLEDLRKEGIVINPPDILAGDVGTSVASDGSIVLGLAEIKDVGDAAHVIVANRDEHGPYTSLRDLVLRTQITSTAAVALAEAGALDSLNQPRMGLVAAAKVVRDMDVPIPDIEWGLLERSARQRIRLGVAVGEHPLLAQDVRAQIREWKEPSFRNGPVIQVHAVPSRFDPNNKWAANNVVGVVAACGERTSFSGRRLEVHLESATGSIKAIMWPRDFGPYMKVGGARIPKVGEIWGITGKTRCEVPVIDDTQEHDEDAADVVREPVYSLTVDDLWTYPLTDPGKALSPAPGTQMVLGLAAVPIDPVKPAAVRRARVGVKVEPDVQDTLFEVAQEPASLTPVPATPDVSPGRAALLTYSLSGEIGYNAAGDPVLSMLFGEGATLRAIEKHPQILEAYVPWLRENKGNLNVIGPEVTVGEHRIAFFLTPERKASDPDDGPGDDIWTRGKQLRDILNQAVRAAA